MSLSVAFLGLVVLMNSLFVANYFIVRSLRLSVETSKLLKERCGNTDDEDEEAEHLSLTERLLKHPKVRKILIAAAGAFGPLIVLYFKIKDYMEAIQEEARQNGKTYTPLDEKLAFFGYMKKERLAERPFPGWKRIPFNAGALSTTILVCLFSVLFSEKILNNTFGLDVTGTNPQSSMCTEGNMNKKIKNVTQGLHNSTNYLNTRRQMQFLTKYRKALQIDTSLYGEGDYMCTNAPFTKEEFFATAVAENDTRASGFFPGMCQAAQALAMEAARSQTCEVEICNTGAVIDESSMDVKNGLIDWDTIKYTVDGSIDVPPPRVSYEDNKLERCLSRI